MMIIMAAELPVGQWIKQRRKLLDLTQADLADRVGCAVVTIQKIEEGHRRPSKQIAELLADHLAIPAEERDSFIRTARTSIKETEPLPPTNLPNPLTTWVGRQQELASVANRLQRVDVRLLTLVGTPGVGKTRLAIEVGHSLRPHFADGIWFVPLAAVTDPGFLLAAIAGTFGLSESGQSPLRNVLCDYLRAKQLLLVLDNFEQLVEHSPLIADLLSFCPSVKALVTSRVPLHLSGEHEVLIQPFPLPEIQQATPESLHGNPAIHLLVDRVRAFQTDFALTADNAAAVAGLCVQLDGLPLALELAAARLRQFTPSALLAQFEGAGRGRLRWLTNGARDLPSRQQTLRNAIAWSYNLLSETERRLFTRLSIFAGGFEIRAALYVGQPATPQSIEADLQSLVDKNLISSVNLDVAERRLILLETLREFALEQLAASAEEDAVRRSHALYFVDVAEAAHPVLTENRDEAVWLAQLSLNQENLRAAMKWTLRHDAPLALRLASALGHFWYVRSQWQEGIDWLRRALQDCQSPPLIRTRAQTALGVLFAFQGNNTEAMICYQQAVHLLQGMEDSLAMAWTLFNYGRCVVMQGDYPTGAQLLDQSAVIWQRWGRQWHVGLAQTQSGVIALEQEDWVRARALLEASLLIHQQWGADSMIAAVSILLGSIEREIGNPARAIALNEEGRAIFTRLNRRGDVAWALRDLGMAELVAGHLDDAGRHLVESLTLYEEIGGKDGVVIILEGLAGLAAARGRPRICAQLLGASNALREEIQLASTVYSRQIDESLFQPARRLLGEDQWLQEISIGRSLPLNKALALARSI